MLLKTMPLGWHLVLFILVVGIWLLPMFNNIALRDQRPPPPKKKERQASQSDGELLVLVLLASLGLCLFWYLVYYSQ